MTQGDRQLSKVDRLTEQMRRYASAERLVLMRNLGYGGAAACLVILVELVQVGAQDASLQVTVMASGIALPLWLLLGATYEFYLFLGTKSYPHLRTDFSKGFLGVVASSAAIAMVCAIGGLIWYLMPTALWAFGVSALVCFVLVGLFHVFIARWWFSADGPGPRNREDEA